MIKCPSCGFETLPEPKMESKLINFGGIKSENKGSPSVNTGKIMGTLNIFN